MQLHDLVRQRGEPLLGRRVAHVVAQVEVGLDPGVLEGAHEGGHEIRLHPEVVPHVLEAEHDAPLRGERREFGKRVLRILRRVVLRGDVRREVPGCRRTLQFERPRVEFEVELRGLRHLDAADAARHEQHHGRAVGLGDFDQAPRRLDGGLPLRGVLRVELGPAAHEGMDLEPVLLRETQARARLGHGDGLVLQLDARETGADQALRGLRVHALADQRLLQPRAEQRGCGLHPLHGGGQSGGGRRQGGALQEVAAVHQTGSFPGTMPKPSFGSGTSSVSSNVCAVNAVFQPL